VDLGIGMIAAVGFFFVLAVCLINLMLGLKTKETTDAILAELQTRGGEVDKRPRTE